MPRPFSDDDVDAAAGFLARPQARDRAAEPLRVTNFLASRFWPARGFRTTHLRLYRAIP